MVGQVDVECHQPEIAYAIRSRVERRKRAWRIARADEHALGVSVTDKERETGILTAPNDSDAQFRLRDYKLAQHRFPDAGRFADLHNWNSSLCKSTGGVNFAKQPYALP
jgi:hypothetical protein